MPITPPPPTFRCEPFTLQMQSPQPEFWQAGLSRSQIRVAPRLKEPQEQPKRVRQRGESRPNYSRKAKADSFSIIQCQHGRANSLLTASLEPSQGKIPAPRPVITTRIPGRQIQSTWKKLQESEQWSGSISGPSPSNHPTPSEQLSVLLSLGTQILSESRSIDWHQPAYHAKLVIYQPHPKKSAKASPRVLQEIRKPFHFQGFIPDLIGVFITGQLNEQSVVQYMTNRVGALVSRTGYEVNPTHWSSPLSRTQGSQSQQIELSEETFNIMSRTAGQYGYQLDRPEQQANYTQDVFRMMQTIAEGVSEQKETPPARLGIAYQTQDGVQRILDLPQAKSDKWA